MIRRAAALLLALCLLAGTAAGARASDAAPDASGKTITVMVYMCGSNLESGGGAATADLMEMAGSGYDAKKVNLLVMTGGTSSWQMGLPVDSLCVYVPFRKSLRMVYAFESMSMGSPDALTALLALGAEKYPADEYALILWNHGGGPMNGVCWDELYDADHLTMEELYAALSASPFSSRKLSWIGFDACLMASAETAYLMAPFADYMIASEETEPSGGWDYSFLKDLEKDPDPVATARRIIDGYFESGSRTAKMTLSCVDLSRMQALSDSMDAFFGDIEINGGSYAWFSYAARGTRAFGVTLSSGDGYDLMDLAGLVRRLENQAPEKATAVLAALEEAVPCSRSGDGLGGGLSVYHPCYNKLEYSEGWADLYPRLGFSAGYGRYVTRFAEYLLGKTADLEWGGLRSAYTERNGVYALPLSDAQREMLSSVTMTVLRWDPEQNAYTRIAAGSRPMEQDGVIYASDNRQILVAVDGDGTPLTGAIPYEVLEDGSIAVYVNYCREEAASTAAAAELPTPGSRTGMKDFGSYSFDDVEITTTSLDEEQNKPVTGQQGSEVPDDSGTYVYSSTLWEDLAPVLADDVVPLTSGEYTELVPVPATLYEALSVSEDAGSVLCLPTASFDVELEPVEISYESLADQNTGIHNYTGSVVPLDSFVTIEVASFQPDQVEVDLTVFDPEKIAKEQAPDLVHAQLVLEAGEDGALGVRETQFYEPLNGEWTSRLTVDPEQYPVLSFPVVRKQPTRAGDALTGYDRWTVVGNDAYRIPNGDFTLCFVPDPDDRQETCILFEVTDIQCSVYASVPILAVP